jgi:hypothetical protein
MGYQLAQANIAYLRAPLDSHELSDFVNSLDPINALADQTAGFVWRLQTEDGNATSIRAFESAAGPGVGIITNMSVWESIEALASFVYRSRHREVLRQRQRWFHTVVEPTLVLWWVAEGHRPSVVEAEQRLLRLRSVGPSPFAFSFRCPFPDPDRPDLPSGEQPSHWRCPA